LKYPNKWLTHQGIPIKTTHGQRKSHCAASNTPNKYEEGYCNYCSTRVSYIRDIHRSRISTLVPGTQTELNGSNTTPDIWDRDKIQSNPCAFVC
jgi:hypothetical protein